MKLAILMALLMSQPVQARVLKCFSETTKNDSVLLVVDKDDGSGVIMERGLDPKVPAHRWGARHSNAQLEIKNGDVKMNAQARYQIDWAQQSKCYVLEKKPRYAISLKSDPKKGTLDGMLQRMPDVRVNPAVKNCNVPNFRPYPPEQVKCREVVQGFFCGRKLGRRSMMLLNDPEENTVIMMERLKPAGGAPIWMVTSSMGAIGRDAKTQRLLIESNWDKPIDWSKIKACHQRVMDYHFDLEEEIGGGHTRLKGEYWMHSRSVVKPNVVCKDVPKPRDFKKWPIVCRSL